MSIHGHIFVFAMLDQEATDGSSEETELAENVAHE
jgi:hypothetical protein